MGVFSFENQGTNTYLVYALDSLEQLDSLSLGMLTNNKIPGLATAMFTQIDETRYIRFCVSARVSVKQFFSGSVSKKRLLGVFTGIVDAMLSAEEYMINSSMILVDLDYIFADVSTCDTVLICLPVLNDETEQVDLGSFFKNIMFTTQFDQTENCDYVARIMNFLNSSPRFSILDFKNLLSSIRSGQQAAPHVQQPVVQQPVAQQPVVQQPVMQQPVMQQPVMQQPVMQQPVMQQPVMQQPVMQQPVAPKQAVRQAAKPPVQARNAPVAVPPQPRPQVQPAQQQPASNEPKITLGYLMQHYNKENAALYKAQKAAKKGQPQQPTMNQPTVPAKQPQKQAAFAVPGAPPANVGFAVPGQAPAPIQQPAVQPSPVVPARQAVPVSVVAPVQQATYVPPVAPQAKPMSFGETTVLGGGGAIGETTVLNAGMQQRQQAIVPHLIRSRNNEKILVNKPVYRIGKEKSYVDYFIGDNTAISRSHVNIITRENKYYVVDTNSTNHTFVDGTMIQSNDEIEITHGTVIRLANEDFEFRLY